ncbi:MAG: HI0074 family nucleotidyltransferase substrate-binding subunit [Candidatus Dependentiae bacterium]
MASVENLKKRYASVKDSLYQLNKNILILKNDPVGKTHYEFMRNSEIQCFEFSLDTFWKLLKEYLLQVYKVSVEVPTPKKVFRESLNIKLITEDEFNALLDAVDARNVTSHTYHEELAQEISQKIPHFYEVINGIFSRLKIDQ